MVSSKESLKVDRLAALMDEPMAETKECSQVAKMVDGKGFWLVVLMVDWSVVC